MSDFCGFDENQFIEAVRHCMHRVHVIGQALGDKVQAAQNHGRSTKHTLRSRFAKACRTERSVSRKQGSSSQSRNTSELRDCERNKENQQQSKKYQTMLAKKMFHNSLFFLKCANKVPGCSTVVSSIDLRLFANVLQYLCRVLE